MTGKRTPIPPCVIIGVGGLNLQTYIFLRTCGIEVGTEKRQEPQAGDGTAPFLSSGFIFGLTLENVPAAAVIPGRRGYSLLGPLPASAPLSNNESALAPFRYGAIASRASRSRSVSLSRPQEPEAPPWRARLRLAGARSGHFPIPAPRAVARHTRIRWHSACPSVRA